MPSPKLNFRNPKRWLVDVLDEHGRRLLTVDYGRTEGEGPNGLYAEVIRTIQEDMADWKLLQTRYRLMTDRDRDLLDLACRRALD